MTKQKVLAVAGILGIAALVLSAGTLAYFTDTESKTNTFTIGNVDITLYESQLHRVNANVSANLGTDGSALVSSENSHVCLNGNIYCTPGIVFGADFSAGNSGVSAWENNHVRAQNVTGQRGAFSDAQIISDSSNNYDAYVTDEYNGLVPGKNVRKFAYVKNTGNNSAYVRIRVTIPSAYKDIIEIRIPHTPQEETTPSGNTYKNGEDATGKYFTQTSTTTNDGDIVYTFVATSPLKKGEMTYWSPITTVKIKDTVKQGDLAYAGIDRFTVKVEADAIQSEGFADAAAAFTAFDIQQ